MKKINKFYNRELSWLSFNARVLQEAEDTTVPLIERIKFLGIFSNNRDEFFRVRVAALRRALKYPKKADHLMGEDPAALLHKIQSVVIEQQNKFEITYKKILKELKQNNIFIINEKNLSATQKLFIKDFFREKVMPLLFPIIIEKNTPFPYLRDKSGYLLVKLGNKLNPKKNKYFIVEVPSEIISRFVVFPKERGKEYVILLDDVIRFCLEEMFTNFEHDYIEAYNIKLTRDAELDIDNDLSKTFVEKITKGLKARKKGLPVRLVYDSEIAPDMLSLIMRRVKLRKGDNLIPGGRYHNFKDFISFPNMGAAELRYEKLKSLKHPALPSPQAAAGMQQSFFNVLKQKDVLLTFPYQSFDHIIDFLREASIDPQVKTIYITLYRVAKHSNVVQALINAIKNGKQVVAVIELQARFDEEANIYWSNKLQEEGAKVIYGVQGLKVHSKLFLITRNEGKKLVNYGYVGTGNFNGDTSRVYTDHGLLTADKRITEEIEQLFCFYQDNLKLGNYKHLLVSPFNLRKSILKLIDNEIEFAKKGKPASIFLKLNNFVDAEVINRFYDASKAGVKIRVIVRGMCSLVAGVPGLSENIQGISIIDKCLEHSRVFIFHNGGNEKYYITSADWMSRNFDQRSEIAAPVYNLEIQKQLKDMMEIVWADNVKARILDKDLSNKYKVPAKGSKKLRAQIKIYEYLKTINK